MAIEEATPFSKERIEMMERCLEAMKRVVLIGVAVMVLATWALPAYAVSPRDPGPVGSRWIPELGQAYCDNFYDGLPMATTPSGAPWGELHQQWVHWCYSEAMGYWVPTSPTYYS